MKPHKTKSKNDEIVLTMPVRSKDFENHMAIINGLAFGPRKTPTRPLIPVRISSARKVPAEIYSLIAANEPPIQSQCRNVAPVSAVNASSQSCPFSAYPSLAFHSANDATDLYNIDQTQIILDKKINSALTNLSHPHQAANLLIRALLNIGMPC